MAFFPVPKSGSAIYGWPGRARPFPSSAAEQLGSAPRDLPLFCCDVTASPG